MKRFAKNGKHYLASSLLQIPGIIINDLFIDESHVKIVAKIKLKHGTCPICSKKSKRLHSIYTRKLRDVAISSKSVVIELQVRKLYCDNIKCKKKIFSQQLDYQIKKYSKRTNRANDCLFELSKETSASKCSGFSKVIQIPVSSSLVTNSEVSPYKQIKHLGIDDWAFRKGKTYGTIMVDRVTGKTIDIINSRDKNDIVNWLKMFPEIETVTRDRSDTYAQSISIALPNTVQIADRFHLVVNYSDYIIRTINRLLPEIRQSILKVNSNDLTEIEWFDKIKEYNPAIQSLCEISANFRNSFEEKSLAKFNEWINQVRDSSFSTLQKVCKLFNEGL
jgi:transposase